MHRVLKQRGPKNRDRHRHAVLLQVLLELLDGARDAHLRRGFAGAQRAPDFAQALVLEVAQQDGVAIFGSQTSDALVQQRLNRSDRHVSTCSSL